MTRLPLLDDDTIDAFLDGEPVPVQIRHLAEIRSLVDVVGDGPPPPASPVLARVLAGAPDAPTLVGAARPATRRRTRLARVAGVGIAVKLAVGVSAAAAGVMGAGAAGVLPETADKAVRHAIEIVSPIEFDDTDPGVRRGDDLTGTSDDGPRHGAGDGIGTTDRRDDGPGRSSGDDRPGDRDGSDDDGERPTRDDDRPGDDDARRPGDDVPESERDDDDAGPPPAGTGPADGGASGAVTTTPAPAPDGRATPGAEAPRTAP